MSRHDMRYERLPAAIGMATLKGRRYIIYLPYDLAGVQERPNYHEVGFSITLYISFLKAQERRGLPLDDIKKARQPLFDCLASLFT